MQSPEGLCTSGEERPISPAKASALCWLMLGAPALCPNRPSTTRCSSADQTRCARPEMPSPSLSSGSAWARICASGTSFQQAETDHLRRDARRQHHVGVERPIAEMLDAVMRPAQADGLAAGQRHRLLRIVDMDLALGLVALDGERLQLPAIDRLVDRFDPRLRDQVAFFVRPRAGSTAASATRWRLPRASSVRADGRARPSDGSSGRPAHCRAARARRRISSRPAPRPTACGTPHCRS